MNRATAPSLLKARLDDRSVRWRIGFVALATDHTAERDFARICDFDEVGLYVNRVAYANPTTEENLLKMAPLLTEAAALILPGEPLDVVAYGCTSASVVIGEGMVQEAIAKAKPNTPVVTPSSAARDAMQTLGARRISVLAPYTAEVSAKIGDYFAAAGFEVKSLDCFGLEDDRDIARVAPESIIEAALECCAPDAEALFLSCTALRAAEVAEAIESRLGRPVVTSNQAMIWRALRHAGCDRKVPGWGRLLQ